MITDPTADTQLHDEVEADAVNVMQEDNGHRIEFRQGSGVLMRYWIPEDVSWRLAARDGEPL